MDGFEVYDFGLRLKKLRTVKKLSQEALAQKLKVSKETIYRYEANTQAIPLETAARLSVLLGTSLDYLAGLENTTVIRLSNLTKTQEEALENFLSAFVQNNP